DREGTDRGALEVTYDRDTLRLDRRTCIRIRDRARRARLRHNQTRSLAHRLLIDELTRQVADKIGYNILGGGNLLGEEDIAGIRQELRGTRQVRIALEEFWPALTPQRLVGDLFGSKERLEAAAPERGPDGREALLREPEGG